MDKPSVSHDPEGGRFGQVDAIKQVLSIYAYALNEPLVYSDPTGYKVNPGDLVNRIKNCVTRCMRECALDHPPSDPVDKCYDKCMIKCVGKGLLKEDCLKHFCIIFPKNETCDSGGTTACDRPQNDATQRQDCCDVKYACCMLMDGW